MRDLNGVEGYISGALWCGTGLLITGLGATSSGSGTYIVAWGAILYGGIQLITGIYQYFTATS